MELISNNMEKGNPLYNMTCGGLNISDIIGLPPSVYEGILNKENYINKIIASSMLIQVYPAVSQGFKNDANKEASKNSEGLSLYDLDYSEGNIQYNKILDSVGVSPALSDGSPIILVGQVDAPISESWTNQYQDSMFESAANLAVPFAKELTSITNTSNLGEALGTISEKLLGDDPKSMGEIGGQFKTDPMGGLTSLLSKISGKSVEAASNMVNSIQNMAGGDPNSMASTIGKLLAGAGLDFPMIWQGSSYNPTYSIRVRLANPNPLDNESYVQYVVKNLLKIQALHIPVSNGPSTYTKPLILSVNCPGLFRLEAAYISSVEVSKGIEGNDISFHQRAGTIDVSIQFSCLYGTMISFIGDDVDKYKTDKRPSLQNYAQNLMSYKQFPSPYELQLESNKYKSPEANSDVNNDKIKYVRTPPTSTNLYEPELVNPTDIIEPYYILKRNTGVYSQFDQIMQDEALANITSPENRYNSYESPTEIYNAH